MEKNRNPRVNFSKMASRLLARDRTRRWDFSSRYVLTLIHPKGQELASANCMRSTRGRGTRELVHFFRLAEATRRQQWHKAGPIRASWGGTHIEAYAS